MRSTLCSTCNNTISNNNIRKHILSCKGPKVKKIRGVDYDPNWGYKEGLRKSWNNGLTAETDDRVADNAIAISKSLEGKSPTGCFGWTKDRRSIHAKKIGLGGYRENAGRSKKYKVIDSFGKEVCLQSSFEMRCAEILQVLSIKWLRPSALKYNNRNYFADFYLPDYDIYLDPKNSYKARLDKEKIDAVVRQNNVRVFVLLEEQITIEYIISLCSSPV